MRCVTVQGPAAARTAREQLARAVEAGGLIVTDTTGVVLNPLDGSWRASRDTAVNYMITAQRPGASGPPAAGGHSA